MQSKSTRICPHSRALRGVLPHSVEHSFFTIFSGRVKCCQLISLARTSSSGTTPTNRRHDHCACAHNSGQGLDVNCPIRCLSSCFDCVHVTMHLDPDLAAFAFPFVRCPFLRPLALVLHAQCVHSHVFKDDTVMIGTLFLKELGHEWSIKLKTKT